MFDICTEGLRTIIGSPSTCCETSSVVVSASTSFLFIIQPIREAQLSPGHSLSASNMGELYIPHGACVCVSVCMRLYVCLCFVCEYVCLID